MGDMLWLVLKNALFFIMGYLVAMEIHATLFFDRIIFCMILSIGPINVCTDFEINRHKINAFRKHAKIVCFI